MHAEVGRRSGMMGEHQVGDHHDPGHIGTRKDPSAADVHEALSIGKRHRIGDAVLTCHQECRMLAEHPLLVGVEHLLRHRIGNEH